MESDGDRLHRWIAPILPAPGFLVAGFPDRGFSGAGFADRVAAHRRLHRAACWLSDTAWGEHRMTAPRTLSLAR